MPAELKDTDVFGPQELSEAEVFGTQELSDQDIGLNVPGEIAGTANEFKRGLLAGQQQLTATELAAAPRFPTMRARRAAYVRGMTDPRYLADVTATNDPQAARKVDSVIGPTGQLRRVQAGIDTNRQLLGEEIATLEEKQQAIPQSAAMAEWGQADNSNWWQVLAKNPVEITAGIMAQSLPAMAPGMALNIAAPGGRIGKAIGTGLGSATVEAANSFLDSARQTGYDFTDPEKVRAFFDNPEAQAKARTFAAERGVPIGILDALTAGLAGKFVGPAMRKGVGPVLKASAKEIALQAAGGASGEALGQAASGQSLNVKDIVAEALGEIASGPQEAISNLRESRGQPPETRPPPPSPIAITPEPPATTPEPAYNEFGGVTETAPSDLPAPGPIAPPGPELNDNVPVVAPPVTETTAARFAREQREASAGLARMRQQDEIAAAVDWYRQDITAKAESGKQKAESEVAPAVTTETTVTTETPAPPLEVTERHLKEAREILAQSERPPDVLDDVAEHAPAGVKFPVDFKRPLENARGAARELASTTKGVPADDALQRMALANPKYADWTVDDLAQAMLAAGETRIAQRKPAAANVQRVAEDLAKAESGKQKAEIAPASEDPNIPFSLAPTPQNQEQTATTQTLATQHAAPGQRVRVVNDANWQVNGQLVEGTVDPDGTTVLNAAAPGMQETGYVRAKLRHERTHAELTSAEGQAQVDRLAGKLTAAQKAELQGMGYVKPSGLDEASYDRWLTNEFIARQAENDTAWWKRYVQHVADWLRGRKGFQDITNEEVAQAILRNLERQQASLTRQTDAYYSLALGTDTRRLSRQIDAATWLTPEQKAALTNRIYTVQNMNAATAVARNLIGLLGLPAAQNLVLDESVGIPPMVRSKLMQEVARDLATQGGNAYADFMNRAINQTTEAGQFISGLQGWMQGTPDGVVATALRILEGASDKVLASYQTLLSAARQALATAHAVATTETINAADVQSAAAAAVDAAVSNDPEVQKALRTEAGDSLAQDEATRRAAAAALPPGADLTDVLNTMLDHFRFAGKDLRSLAEKLQASGVPARYAEAFSNSLEATWKRKVEALQASLPKHLRNIRLSKEVLTLAERIVRGLETQAVDARARLKAKFAPKPAGQFSLAPSPDQQTLADLAAVGASYLGRESLNFADWSARLVGEFGDGVQPFMERAYPLAQQRLAAEGLKHAGGRAARTPGATPALPDTALNRMLRDKLRQWNQTLGQAIARQQMGRKLGDAIVADSKLTGAAAEQLRERINTRFAKLASERKQKALDRLLRDQPKGRKTKSPESALRKLVEMHNIGALDDAKFADAVKTALGLKTLTPAETAKLRQLAQEMQAIPEDQEQRRQTAAMKITREVARLRPGHWWDFPMGLWYAHVLSGPATHFVNAASNALNLSATLAAVTVQNPARLQQIIPQLARGTRQALPEMWHALTEGAVTGPRLGEKFNDPGVWERVDSRWALPWKLVGRALAAGDLLFFYPAYQVQQGVMARAIARSEGVSGRNLNRRVSEILFNTDAARSAAAVKATSEGYTSLTHRRRVEEIIQAQRDETANFGETGREFALRTTFNNKPYGLLGAIAQAINTVGARFPATRLVIPFTNIIANVTNESLNYTPIGSLRALATRFGGANLYGKQADVTSWADQNALAELHAKAALGTLLLTALVLKAASHADDDDPPFMVTGQGPQDANKRKTWLAAGNLPNSIKLGNRSYTFQNTPAAVPLAVIGNMLDAYRFGKLSEASTFDRVALALALSGKTLVQQSFLDSLARLFGAVEYPSPRTTGRNIADWAGRTGSSLVVPNAVKQVEQIFNPSKYDDYTVQGELLRHIPFVRVNERPTLNGLGEPIERPLSERFTKPQNPDPLWRELARLNVGVYPVRMEWQGETLTEEQLYDVARRSGPLIRRDLERLMTSPSYSRWKDDTKGRAFDKVIQGRHKEAKMKVVSGR